MEVSTKKNSVLFLLGAGASVDSGLKTYRGGENRYNKFDETDDNTNPVHVSALFDEERVLKLQNHFEEIKRDIPEHPGETYLKIKSIADQYEHCMIVTQNIDGLVSKICDNVVELHGSLCNDWICLKCMSSTGVYSTCSNCGSRSRPDVILFGETVPGERFARIIKYINIHRPSVCYVIGTSLRFRYLQAIIQRAKMRQCKIVHVNPDPDYKFHLQNAVCKFQSGTETRMIMKKKKKPEELFKSLWDI